MRALRKPIWWTSRIATWSGLGQDLDLVEAYTEDRANSVRRADSWLKETYVPMNTVPAIWEQTEGLLDS